MKLLIDIDDKLLARVKDITCAKTDAEAILAAAENMAEFEHMKEYFSNGPYPSAEEFRNGWDPNYKLDGELIAQAV